MNSSNIEDLSMFQMTSTKRIQYYNIPIQIDGKTKIVKSVTKSTTCNDVINKLPKTDAPLAVFQSVNGEVKELSGKTKFLKVWRSYGSAKKVTFIVKKSEGQKERRLSLNIFGARNSRKSIVPVSKDQVKQVGLRSGFLHSVSEIQTPENDNARGPGSQNHTENKVDIFSRQHGCIFSQGRYSEDGSVLRLLQ